MKADFSGYATKAGILCSDGRTIMPDAFKHQDKVKIPLVWMHKHDNSENVLGHAILENRSDGVYAYGFFNETPSGINARELVKHGDVSALSIYANQLKQRGAAVIHGVLRELSLVLSGANPEAFIENISLAHSDGSEETLADEAIIFLDIPLEHGGLEVELVEDAKTETVEVIQAETQVETVAQETSSTAEIAHSTEGATVATDTETTTSTDSTTSSSERTGKDILETFNEEQTQLLNYVVGTAVEEALATANVEHSDMGYFNPNQEGSTMGNVFDQNDNNTLAHSARGRKRLTVEQVQALNKDADRLGSFKEAMLMHADAGEYGIDDIEYLFPDARTLSNSPDIISRRMEWVTSVLNGARHTPFSRIKSLAADITADEARAKGYIKGNLKKEEVIKLLRRITTPTTIYKKQKLDRDDIIDITDLDIVAWMKVEMRIMLDEELARAILIGDGREIDDPDKIDEEHIRPIAFDDDMYAHHISVASNISPKAIVTAILRSRTHYKGTGTPTLFTTDVILTDLILIEDQIGRRLYDTEAQLAAALRVKDIVVVEAMESVPDLLAILVNMSDYTIGADKGGSVTFFEDFDIDYNQEKYLLETRCSGTLTKPKSAVVISRASGTVVAPSVPSYAPSTRTITFPTVAGVEYFVGDSKKTGTLVITQPTVVVARPADGYSFEHNTDADWEYIPTA